MKPLNKVEMRGRVGSHTISLRDDGHWEGWFDLYVVTKNIHNLYQSMVFDCHVVEDGKNVKDLGAGIGGSIVHITGRIVQYPDNNTLECYIHVDSLKVVGGPMDKMEFEGEE